MAVPAPACRCSLAQVELLRGGALDLFCAPDRLIVRCMYCCVLACADAGRMRCTCCSSCMPRSCMPRMRCGVTEWGLAPCIAAPLPERTCVVPSSSRSARASAARPWPAACGVAGDGSDSCAAPSVRVGVRVCASASVSPPRLPGGPGHQPWARQLSKFVVAQRKSEPWGREGRVKDWSGRAGDGGPQGHPRMPRLLPDGRRV